MSATSLQLQLPEKGGKFITTSVSRPVPGPDEVCIHTKAIGLNPVDWKIQTFGFMVSSWPVVLGSDAAGVIDSVGENINGLKPGDEVFCLAGGSNRAGAFQETMIIPSYMVAKKPGSLTFEEAASLPLCYLTAAAAIVLGLHVSLPSLIAPESRSLKSVLVLGGSSAVGAAAIQLLRLVLPTAVIFTTSSPKHHSHLISLGANQCFDRTKDISALKAATPQGEGLDAILDAVGAAASQPAVFDALSVAGPKIYSQVETGQTVKIPNDINATAIRARQLFGTDDGMTAIAGLADLLDNGKYELPVKVEVVGQGLDSIEKGLERLRNGVSGTKCVITL